MLRTVFRSTTPAFTWLDLVEPTRADLDAYVSAYPEAGGRLMAGILTLMSRRLRTMISRIASKEMEADFHELWH